MPAKVKPQAADETKHEQASRRAAAPQQKTQGAPIEPAPSLHRPAADLPAVLRAADIEALQRTLGNQAVQRRLAASLQRNGHAEAKRSPLIQPKRIGPKQVAPLMKANPRQEGESDADYIERLLDTDQEFRAVKDIAANRQVLQGALSAASGRGARAVTPPAKKRELTEAQREHLFKGSYRSKVLSGYHSKQDAGAIAEGYGPKTDLGNGFYKQSVQLKNNDKVKKAKQSTFYPDDWTEQEIVEAIEYATELKLSKVTLYEVTRPEKCKGIQLF